MQRREALHVAGAIGLSGITSLSGCLDDVIGVTDGSTAWSHGVAGRVEHRVNGRVFGREDFTGDGADGGVFALDAADGSHLWTYGETGGYTTFSDLAVDDAIYVGFGDDAIGSGSGELYVLEFDGAERWTRETGSVYSQPVLDDDTVYVGTDTPLVHAFSREDGTERWRTRDVTAEEIPESPRVTAVGDAVYVGGGFLTALDPRSGDVRWRYGEPDDRIRRPTVVDDVAFLAIDDHVVAVEGGEERWHETVPGGVYDVVDGRVLVLGRERLTVLDAVTGDRLWDARVEHPVRATGDVDVVYAATGEGAVRALDAGTGAERWSRSFTAGDEVRSLWIVTGADTALLGASEDSHALLVQDGRTHLHAVSAGGEVAWTEQVEGAIRSVLVDGGVFVGTQNGVFRIAPA